MRRLATTILACAALFVRGNAAPANNDTSGVWVPGVLFSFGASDGSIVKNGNALSVWLGAGYEFSSAWKVAMLFSTGHQHLDPSPARPVSGTLLLGAATLDVIYRFPGEAAVRPYVGGGGGLSTILDEQSRGYNGWVLDLRAGAEWSMTAAFDLDLFVGWNAWTWQNGVGDNVPPFSPMHLDDVVTGISLVFRPVLHR